MRRLAGIRRVENVKRERDTRDSFVDPFLQRVVGLLLRFNERDADVVPFPRLHTPLIYFRELSKDGRLLLHWIVIIIALSLHEMTLIVIAIVNWTLQSIIP